jgi:DNA-binding Lrp family transcriptional regulator
LLTYDLGMPVHAYILVQTEVGRAAGVTEEARNIEGVTEAHELMGSYDVIIKATVDQLDQLGPVVVHKVQAIQGITRTITCPVTHT